MVRPVAASPKTPLFNKLVAPHFFAGIIPLKQTISVLAGDERQLPSLDVDMHVTLMQTAKAALWTVLCVCLIGRCWAVDVPSKADEADSARRVLLDQVAKRLFAVIEPAAGMPWPPTITIVLNDEPNAFAHLRANDQGIDGPEIVVHSSIFDKVVCGQPDRLAFLLGHELSHLTCGHVLRKQGDVSEFVRCSAGREQELEADAKGLELALKAGFSLPDCLSFIHTFIELKDYSTFEGLLVDHPSWRERLSHLDKEHTRLWRASAVFHAGNQLLLMEQFDAAVDCFQSVTTDFPNCREAWCNLGFAQLLQYYDNLTIEHLRLLNVGQLVLGGFGRRSTFLDSETQGPSEDIWRDAVAALSHALAIDPDFAAATGALGAAYLLAPEGKDIAKARPLLDAAMSAAQRDADRDAESASQLHLALLLNSAVADLCAGDTARADEKLDRAQRELSAPAAGLSNSSYLWSVLLYNRALRASSDAAPEARLRAIAAWERYLQSAGASRWWELGYSTYRGLCDEQKTSAKGRQSFRESGPRVMREVTSLSAPGGGPLFLTESWQEVERRLGESELASVVHGTSLRRASYAQLGLGLIVDDDDVLAILLNSSAAPEIVVRETGPGAESHPLRIGMKTEDLEQILPQVPEYGYFIDHDVNYRLYREVGLAVRVHKGAIVELILARFPKPRS